MKKILDLVDEAEKILTDKHGDIDDFGRLLDVTWHLKRNTGSKVSSSLIDEIYETGKKNGALGGKLLGAGGGGFMLFYCVKEHQAQLLNALHQYMYVPFKFENEGTSVLFYNPVEYSPRKHSL